MKRLGVLLFSLLLVVQPLAAQGFPETPVWPPPQNGDILQYQGTYGGPIGPYMGALNYGPAYVGFGPTFTMYCTDRYHTAAPVGSSWMINASNLDNGADLSNTRMDGATFLTPPVGVIPGYDTLTRYRMAVWLATRFNAAGTNWNGVQGAIWALLTKDGDPGMFNTMGFNGTWAAATYLNDPDYWLQQVQTVFNGGQPDLDYKWWYVMSDVNTWTTNQAGERVEGVHKQEFLVHATPEPATYILLVSGLLAVGVVARRRAKDNGYL